MKKFTVYLFVTCLMLFSVNALHAQSKGKKKKGKGKTTAAAPKKKDAIKSIKELTKKCQKFDGLFPIYQDSTSGKAYILVTEEQLDKEYIYFSQTVNGVLEAGWAKGFYNADKVFSIKKYYNQIEFVQENVSYYFDEENALSNAADANINRPILVSEKVVGQNKEKTEFLISANSIFLSEKMQPLKYSPPSGAKGDRFSLGSLSKDKTKFSGIKNYPENTDIRVDYVFDNPMPRVWGSAAVTDARNVTVTLHHSIIAMPDNNYQPRYDDARVGYFGTQVTDMTSPEATPYKDLIHRWHLEKKDPDAALSEPVEPITWWIENTTPVEFRETIKEAALKWNMAFEQAGFKNAMQVKIQPDDADWDAGDIRYNVLRWTSSPRPPFGGYGPSFVNPRTGQILGADIMLEYVFLTNRTREEQIYVEAAMPNYDVEIENMHNNCCSNKSYCSFGQHLHNEIQTGMHIMKAQNYSAIEETEFIKQALTGLILHELGHTLGLTHNFMASTIHSATDINDMEKTKIGLTGSVMDYTPTNLALTKEEQGLWFDIIPGPYDKWAIEYGYSQGKGNADEEEKRLNKVLAKSTNPLLGYGNDADDMRGSGKGIDPRIMIFDMTSEPVKFGINRIKLVESTLPTIKEKFTQDDEKSYHELRSAFLRLTGSYASSVWVFTRQIGGVHINRAVVGQETETKPLTPVAYDTQKEAMNALATYAFAPDAYSVPDELYQYLLRQRRGFSHWGVTDDPKIHNRILRSQKGCLDQLLHPTVLTRISDSEMYGNEYSLTEMMTDLTDAIVKDDLKTAVNTKRQNLQMEYVKRLANIIAPKSKYDTPAQSMALYEIKRIQKSFKSALSPDVATRAHRQHILFEIEKALDTGN